MEEHDLFNILAGITIAGLVFNLFIFFTGLSFIITNDYILHSIYETSEELVASAGLPIWVTTVTELTGNTFKGLIGMFDSLFILGFVIFAGSSLWYSYKAKKENIFSILSLITVGFMVLFFIMNIIISLSDWFYNLTILLIPILSNKLPYFTLYCQNMGLVNLILFVCCIILNVTNLNFSKDDNKEEERIKVSED